jgi:HD-GYP domain-containing protein (c-di-GMP phosphodiesterase class II)
MLFASYAVLVHKVLERGQLLQDIGKIGIRDIIVHKPEPLNKDEWKIMACTQTLTQRS